MRKSLIPFVGITGGIGSGKSTICRIFSCLGIPIFETDSKAKNLISTDPLLKKALIDLMGADTYDSFGKYDLKYVKNILQQKPEIVTLLNEIIHPAVRSAAKLWHSKITSAPFALYESALMTSENKPDFIDQIIAVSSPIEDRIKRLAKRNPETNLIELRHFIAIQPKPADLLKNANFILDNSLNSNLWPQIKQIATEFGLKI